MAVRLVRLPAPANTRSAGEVVKLHLFGRVDVLIEKYSIYKVETVGDAYIAGQAEQPLTFTHSPVAVILLGLAMVNENNECLFLRPPTIILSREDDPAVHVSLARTP